MNSNRASNIFILCTMFLCVYMTACDNRYRETPELVTVTIEECLKLKDCDVEGKPNGMVCPCQHSCVSAAALKCSGSGFFCAPQCAVDADCEPGTTCDEELKVCTDVGVTPENEGTCGWDPEAEIRVYVDIPVDVNVDVDVPVNPPQPVCDGDGRCEAGESFTDCPLDCYCDNDGVCEPLHGENEQTCPNDCDQDPVDYDQDNDGHDRPPYGYDCDDTDPWVHPGATEVCNGVDDDCDGLTDEDGVCDQPTYTFYRDADQDGYTTGQTMTSSSPTPPAGWRLTASSQLDCDDSDPAVYPGAVEVCNQKDDDCDGLTDEDGVCPVDHDQDNDGYDAEPWGNDCDDTNPAINPGAIEVCINGVDEDCDGLTDEGCVVDHDLDDDGFDGEQFGGDDCDDSNPAINPGATEVCNGVDDDCDGLTDEDGVCDQDCLTEGEGAALVPQPQPECCPGLTQISCDYVGSDGECVIGVGCEYLCTYCGNGVCKDPENKCNCPADCDKDGDGFQVDTEDCNDFNPAIHPGAEEVCNQKDDDCDGLTDEGNVCGGAFCGDGNCDPGETHENCPEDCPSGVCDHDGVIDSGEECDSTGDDYTNLDGKTCADFGFSEGALYCYWDTCTFSLEGCWNPSPGEVCDHDGVIDPGEYCDSTGDDYTNLNGKTCEDFGYDGGQLYCYWATCDYSFEGCWYDPVPDGSQWVARDGGNQCIELNGMYLSYVSPSSPDEVYLKGDCPGLGLYGYENEIEIEDGNGDGWYEFCWSGSPDSAKCEITYVQADPNPGNEWSCAQYGHCATKDNWEEVCGPYLHCDWDWVPSDNGGTELKYVCNVWLDLPAGDPNGFVAPY